jgi:predicted nucleotidyltransferase
MIITLFDKNCAKLLLLMLISPGRNHQRKEIQEKSEMNNVPLDNSLSKLFFLGLIKRKNMLYSLNLENDIIERLLHEREKLLNIPLKVQYLLIEFVDLVSKLRQIKKAILFGSYSKLIYHEKSDIDIAIIFENKIKSRTKLERNIFLIKNKLSKKYKKNIQTHFFNEADMKHKEDPLIRDILVNGKSLI